MWSQERTVTKTATVSMHGNTYEVDAALAGRKVDLIFDPFDLTGSRSASRQHRGLAVPLVISRHAHPQAQPPAAPAQPTGIDYLKLLQKRETRSFGGGSTTATCPPRATRTNNDDGKEMTA